MQTLNYNGNIQRIDSRLSSEFSYSRNFFHHIIERGGIKVNGNIVKKSYKIKNGDNVEIDELERYLSPIILEESENVEIPIIYEEDDYLIINKPKGVLSHPNSIRDVKQPSVVAFLYHYFKDLPSYGNFIRAGLVHRLDKDTNGLMIIAKTEKGLQHFKSLFQEKSESSTLSGKEDVPLQKYYKASCYITPKGKDFLLKIEKNGLPFYIQENVCAKVPNTTPKLGITKILNYKISKGNIIEFCLQILTGRTHQIRYHLSHHGLPIVGDYLYGKEELGIQMQLTAYKLQYLDLKGETKVFELK